jgi:hypothetical protein
MFQLTQHNTADKQGQPMNNRIGSRSNQRREANQLHNQSPDWLALRSAPEPESDINTRLQDTRPPVAT